MKQRIDALTSLRAFAIISVFIYHLNYMNRTSWENLKNILSFARLAVDFFFVLSGFLIAMGYSNKFQEKVSKNDYIIFIRRRIERIYPTYLFTIIICIPYYLYVNTNQPDLLKGFIIRMCLAIPLLQSLVPIGNYANAINGVAWFLSCIFILYLLTPPLLHINSKIKKKPGFILALMVGDIAAFGVVYMIFRDWQYIRFTEWNLSLIYATPYIRIFAFIFGILLFDLWVSYSARFMHIDAIEMFSVIICVVWWLIAERTGLPMVFLEAINIIIVAGLIYIFSYSKGFLSRILNNKILVYLGSISFDFYLIHYPVINYSVLLCDHLNIMSDTVAVLLAVFSFICSLMLSILLHKFSDLFLYYWRSKGKRGWKIR